MRFQTPSLPSRLTFQSRSDWRRPEPKRATGFQRRRHRAEHVPLRPDASVPRGRRPNRPVKRRSVRARSRVTAPARFPDQRRHKAAPLPPRVGSTPPPAARCAACLHPGRGAGPANAQAGVPPRPAPQGFAVPARPPAPARPAPGRAELCATRHPPAHPAAKAGCQSRLSAPGRPLQAEPSRAAGRRSGFPLASGRAPEDHAPSPAPNRDQPGSAPELRSDPRSHGPARAR